MKITKAIETPEGTVQFNGELNASEVEFMTEWFLSTMLRNGALPFASLQNKSTFVSPDQENSH